MIFRILTTAAMIVFTMGCDKFLAGKPKKQDFIEVKKDSLKCLKNLSTQVKSYLNAESTDTDIDTTFACLDTTLAEFQKRAEGSEVANAFNEDDLFQIFKTFLSDANISREATTDLLKLKRGMLGGSENSLTKTEITQLRDLLKVLKPELHLLLPYAKLFQFTSVDKLHSKEHIATGFKQLNVTLKKLLAASQLSRSNYHFDDFKSLLDHLQFTASKAKGRMQLVTDVKNLLTGAESLQSTADFETIIDSLVQILELTSLRTENHVLFEIKDSASLKESVGYLESWIGVLENSLQFKRRGFVSAESIDALITKVVDEKLLPPQLTAGTLVRFYKMILVRTLEKGIAGDLLGFSGVQRIHITNLKREINAFKLYSNFFDSVTFIPAADASGVSRAEISTVQSQLKSFSFKNAMQSRADLDPSEQAKIVKIVDELRTEFLNLRPVVYRFDKIVIAANQESVKQSWHDLTKALFVKFLARGLMLGWGNTTSTRQIEDSYLTEANLVQWYEEFKALGIETKAFDPRSANSGARSFKEANLFSYSADGDNRMNMFESIQYLNILVSGGSTTLAEVKMGLAAANCNLSELDVFEFPWNDEVCALTDFKVNYKYYFNNLPYLVGFLSRLNDQQFTEFYYQAMEVSRVNPAMKGKLETADLRTFTILLHYIEAMYAQFDIDRNWTFSAQEIRGSYPRFKSFATDFAKQTASDQIALFNLPLVQELGYGCYTQEDLIRESFIFLVYKGVTPGITDLNLAPCFGKRALIPFSGEVDRKTIINTFKILKAVLGS